MGSREEQWISVRWKAASPGLSYPAVSLCHVLGGPGQLVLLKDRAVGVARAVRGDYFCRFVKNKTKAGL